MHRKVCKVEEAIFELTLEGLGEGRETRLQSHKLNKYK